MKLFDRKCLGCGATYGVAASEKFEGRPGHFTCAICGDEFERWDEPSLRVCRLLFAAEPAGFRMPPSVRGLP